MTYKRGFCESNDTYWDPESVSEEAYQIGPDEDETYVSAGPISNYTYTVPYSATSYGGYEMTPSHSHSTNSSDQHLWDSTSDCVQQSCYGSPVSPQTSRFSQGSSFDNYTQGYPSSPEEFASSGSYRDEAGMVHNTTDHGSPLSSNGSRESKRKGSQSRYQCPDCDSSHTRRADLDRHQVTIHQQLKIDCPINNCDRKGDHGFKGRLDHLREHLKTVHRRSALLAKEDIMFVQMIKKAKESWENLGEADKDAARELEAKYLSKKTRIMYRGESHQQTSEGSGNCSCEI